MNAIDSPNEGIQINTMTAAIAQRLAYIKQIETDLFDALDNLHYLNEIGASEHAKDATKYKIARLSYQYVIVKL